MAFGRIVHGRGALPLRLRLCAGLLRPTVPYVTPERGRVKRGRGRQAGRAWGGNAGDVPFDDIGLLLRGPAGGAFGEETAGAREVALAIPRRVADAGQRPLRYIPAMVPPEPPAYRRLPAHPHLLLEVRFKATGA